ncbi:MAG: hypothetical protein ABJA81_04765 [Nocardioidaceae bacterium]
MDDIDHVDHVEELLAEIDMLRELVITAARSSGSLRQDQVDTILGLDQASTAAPASPPVVPRQHDPLDVSRIRLV